MKIAIVGTATHAAKAPWSDPTWEIWAANIGKVPRWDRWFDLHDDASIDTYPGHREFLESQTKPVYRQSNYPLDALVAKYGTWFFTSTISYMMALAIEENPKEIGLWGVDLAHETEYKKQKPGCRFFIQTARLAGIKVTMPDEACVNTPGVLYCFDKPALITIQAQARVEELRATVAENEKAQQELLKNIFMLSGAKGLTLASEQIDAALAQNKEQLAQAEKDALRLDGALQDANHFLINFANGELP
jgi:hypothetical protein